MIWAHSINPIAMEAAIAVTVYAVLSICGFGVWVLYALWLERTGERPDFALRLMRRWAGRIGGALGGVRPAAAAAGGYRACPNGSAVDGKEER